jgi:hypothetical protein
MSRRGEVHLQRAKARYATRPAPLPRKVSSFKALPKLKIDLRPIQISRAGNLYKARFEGEANFAFGETAELAEQRLRTAKDFK